MPNLLDLNEVLSHTQSLRMRIIDDLTKEGIPALKENVELLNKTLDSMDKAVIAKKRLTIDENVSNYEKEAAKLLTQILSQFTNPRLEKVIQDRAVDIHAQLQDRDMVADETFIGVQEISLDSIIQGE